MEKQAHDHKEGPSKSLTLSFWLNLCFSILEAVGGVWTNSTAIITDAFHDFMDALSIGMAIQAEKLSAKKRTSTFSYGLKRFSLLSALIMSLMLLVGAVFMGIKAIGTFSSPKDVDSVGMLVLALIGLGVNGFAFFKIKHGNTHHGHSHGETNLNTRSIMLHLLEDVLGWAAVLIGAGVMYLTGWNWIDGLLALCIALFIGFNASRNLVGTLKIMLQALPDNMDVNQIYTDIKQVEGVRDIHDLHIWSLDGNYHVASLHVVVGDSLDMAGQVAIRSQVEDRLRKAGIAHPTIQIESQSESCRFISC